MRSANAKTDCQFNPKLIPKFIWTSERLPQGHARSLINSSKFGRDKHNNSPFFQNQLAWCVHTCAHNELHFTSERIIFSSSVTFNAWIYISIQTPVWRVPTANSEKVNAFYFFLWFTTVFCFAKSPQCRIKEFYFW